MITFRNDDPGYLAWLGDHPEGYVLNVQANPSPSYVVLHRAACWTISRPLDHAGGYTERSYRKIVADTKDALRSAAVREGRPDRTFSSECSHCRP